MSGARTHASGPADTRRGRRRSPGATRRAGHAGTTPPLAQTNGAAGDLETRERLLAAAATLFAARGFARVPVRDICQAAGANVAAINYHFNGKNGLYEQVLRRAIGVMQHTTTEAMETGRDKHPREQLRIYVSIFIRRVFESRDGWIHQLMMRELANPTPALDFVVNEVMKPRMQYLTRVIADLLDLPIGDTRVSLCAISVQAQCLAVLRSGFSDRLGMIEVNADTIDDIAQHIARFSLGGIKAV